LCTNPAERGEHLARDNAELDAVRTWQCATEPEAKAELDQEADQNDLGHD